MSALHIRPSSQGRHRGRPYYTWAWSSQGRRWVIGGIEAYLINTQPRGEEWWIVAMSSLDDYKFTDIGPFSTANEAAVVATLMDGT